jgi:TonB family protein
MNYKVLLSSIILCLCAVLLSLAHARATDELRPLACPGPDSDPILINAIQPAYPTEIAKMERYPRGVILVMVQVTAEGRVDRVALYSATDSVLLNDVALHAAQRATFEPASHCGQGVQGAYLFSVDFMDASGKVVPVEAGAPSANAVGQAARALLAKNEWNASRNAILARAEVERQAALHRENESREAEPDPKDVRSTFPPIAHIVRATLPPAHSTPRPIRKSNPAKSTPDLWYVCDSVAVRPNEPSDEGICLHRSVSRTKTFRPNRVLLGPYDTVVSACVSITASGECIRQARIVRRSSPYDY